MVYRDLFTSESLSPLETSYAHKPSIPFVMDRFVALVFDFLIFSPVISLVGAGLLRHMKTLLLLNPTSSEAVLVWCFLAGLMFFLISGLQAIFLYFWQATPGQMFLQLRVVSYPEERERLTIGQCWQRGVFWTLGLCTIFPFAEILSHPLRRAFYDRASDTMVVTLKRYHDTGPMPLESRFISSWLRLFFLIFLFAGTLSFFKTYHSLRALLAQDDLEAHDLVCEDERLKGLEGDQRLDTALALYILNAVKPECVEQEADARLWSDPTANKELAYLAKAVVVEDKKILEKYQSQLCQDAGNEVCRLSKFLLDDQEVKLGSGSFLSTQVAVMEQQAGLNSVAALKDLKSLQANVALADALQKKYVRLIWSLAEEQRSPDKASGRAPASTEAQELINEFKKDYELP